MIKSTKYVIIFLGIMICLAVTSDLLYTKDSTGVSTMVYKTVGDTDLKVHIFFPPNFKASDKRPAFIYFHGGGWVQGEPEWGYKDCKHFASLGMVAFSVEYRLIDQNKITPVELVADVKSAVRWVRIHAKKFGIDTSKLISAGMSAGSHLAACTGIIEGYDEKGEDLKISSRTNALVLLSPPVDPTVDPWFMQILKNRVNAEELSPTHHVRSGLPPTIIFQGEADKIVPYLTVKEFTKKMAENGNICELHLFENCDHLLSCVDSNKITNMIDGFLIKNKMLKKISTLSESHNMK